MAHVEAQNVFIMDDAATEDMTDAAQEVQRNQILGIRSKEEPCQHHKISIIVSMCGSNTLPEEVTRNQILIAHDSEPCECSKQSIERCEARKRKLSEAVEIGRHDEAVGRGPEARAARNLHSRRRRGQAAQYEVNQIPPRRGEQVCGG